MVRGLIVEWLSLALTSMALAGETAPRFTKKPAAVKEGDRVTIAFAVDKQTDVSVFIENAKGEIVRHLASGVLGKNPPAPLRADSLEQSVAWDLRDDFGRPVEGACRARVSLGIRPTFDRVMFDDPQNLAGGVRSLAVSPKGDLYVNCQWADGGWGTGTIRVLSREGTYLRTIVPFPAGLPFERVAGFGALRVSEAAYLPFVHYLSAYCFYPAFIAGGAQKGFSAIDSQMAVDADGRIFVPGNAVAGGPSIGILDANGGVPAGWSFLGAGLRLEAQAGKGLRPQSAAFLAVSSGGDRLYLSGLREGGQKTARPAVFWASAQERGLLQVLAGDPAKEGSEGGLLRDPQGIATDGDGHLLVADRGNDRIAVFDEKDGRFLAAFEVKGADRVQVDRKTGAVYVLTQAPKSTSLIKFSDWKAHREVCRAAVPPCNFLRGCSLALDAAASPPVIWVGSNGYRPFKLLRYADAGTRFEDPAECGGGEPDNMLEDVFVDRIRNEVYVYRHDYYWRLADGADQAEKVPVKVSGNWGTQLQVGPSGNIYAYSWGNRLRKFDRDGKPITFGSTGEHLLKMRSGMTYQMRQMFVDPRTEDIYIIQPPPPPATEGGKLLCVMRVYDREGTFKKEVCSRLSEGACGPRLDLQGNIYVGESARPGSPDLPPFFADKIPPLTNDKGIYHVDPKAWTRSWGYGSIVKFSPAGGEILIPPGGKLKDPANINYTPWSGEVPDAVPLDFYYHSYRQDIKVAPSKGVLWARTGFSPVPRYFGWDCNCLAAYFDVDFSGRVFHPDACQFRVGLLDSNGNEIGHFGEYGNRDARADGRRIPFGFPIAVAATDRHAYVGDIVNCRLVRLKLAYAAQATCEVR